MPAQNSGCDGFYHSLTKPATDKRVTTRRILRIVWLLGWELTAGTSYTPFEGEGKKISGSAQQPD